VREDGSFEVYFQGLGISLSAIIFTYGVVIVVGLSSLEDFPWNFGIGGGTGGNMLLLPGSVLVDPNSPLEPFEFAVPMFLLFGGNALMRTGGLRESGVDDPEEVE